MIGTCTDLYICVLSLHGDEVHDLGSLDEGGRGMKFREFGNLFSVIYGISCIVGKI